MNNDRLRKFAEDFNRLLSAPAEDEAKHDPKNGQFTSGGGGGKKSRQAAGKAVSAAHENRVEQYKKETGLTGSREVKRPEGQVATFKRKK